MSSRYWFHSYLSVFVQITSSVWITFENFVFQTEPVNINEESEVIDQNSQVRNQGIIALSYRDWEVKLCTLRLGVLGRCGLTAVQPVPKCALFSARRL